MDGARMEHAHSPEKADTEEPPLTLLWGTWEMWCGLPQRHLMYTTENPNWLEQVKSIGLFDSAEGFWAIFNCTILPSQLAPNASFYLFRKNIAPMWEHEANRRGGKWVIPFFSKSAKPEDEMQAVDAAWQTLCLCAIGELFPCEEEEICGVTVSRSKQRTASAGYAASSVSEWKLCLWTRSAGDAAVQTRIANFIRQQLNPALCERSADGNQLMGTDSKKEDGAGTEGQSPPLRVREVAGLPATITYVAHRELMEAKQDLAKGGGGGGGFTQSFKPKYTISMGV